MEFICETSVFLKETARKYNDVYIHTTNRDNQFKTIEANKVILASFSKYFQLLFDSRTFNSIVDIVIMDTSYEIVKLLMEFIYEGRVYVRSEHCNDFKTAAGKFNIVTAEAIKPPANDPMSGSFEFHQTIKFPGDFQRSQISSTPVSHVKVERKMTEEINKEKVLGKPLRTSSLEALLKLS